MFPALVCCSGSMILVSSRKQAPGRVRREAGEEKGQAGVGGA